MAFNIASFNENINRHGVLAQNKFDVQIQDKIISPSTGITTLFSSLVTRMNLAQSEAVSIETALSIHKDRIENVRLPGVSIDTYDTRRYGVGPSIRTATNARFETFSISVMTDEKMHLHKFFYTWLSSIFDFAGSNQSETIPTYLVGYKENYATDITVNVYDNTGAKRSEYQFLDAFPVTLSDPSLAWNNNNSIHKFMVNFSYTHWKVQNFL